MIRINLLPFRAAKKRENIKRQISVFALVVILVLAGIAYVFLQLNGELNDLKDQNEQLKQEKVKYDKDLKRIAELERKIKEVEAKIKVIKTLEEKKKGPVQLLDEIATAVPKDKLWLTSLSETGGVLKITGTAMDNETVALFMTNLEKAERITTVELVSTKLTHLPQYRLNVADFVLECKTYDFEQKQTTGAPPPRS